ncbi:MAG: HD domain-containing protein [Chitinivibrionales bacterium]|nr:HD domain-containing protein [Chitinivibrionales bacterium]
MKELHLSDLTAGDHAENALYSSRGELLIAENALITQNHLNALKRRNIELLYAKSPDDTDEIQVLLSKKFENLDPWDDMDSGDAGQLDEGFNLDDEPEGESGADDHPRGAIRPPVLKDIRPGKEGLEQLNNSTLSRSLDSEIDSGKVTDEPEGPRLREQATQISPADRTDDYKQDVSFSYSGALKEITAILTELAKGNIVDGGDLASIVERFVKIFVTDRNILLNISGIKHTDDYLFNHCLNVCLLSINIAASAGYSEKQIIEIGIGALVHDIGMLLVPESIRFQPGKLSTDDWFEVQKHPVLGLHLLEKIRRLPESVRFIPYQVHERENSRGYPKQRHGRLINRYAKIVQLADVFEAMSSPRSYRKAMLPFVCMQALLRMVKEHVISPDFIKAFISYTSLYPVGSLVMLNDYRIAKVIHANESSYTKPVVNILTAPRNNAFDKKELCELNLKLEPQMRVIKALPVDYVKGAGTMDGF